MKDRKRLRIRVYGIVQGVGFRPFISRLAAKYDIFGTVCNKGSYVEIFAQGTKVDAFVRSIREEAPPRSVILKIRTEALPLVEEIQSGDGSDANNGRFNIIDSEKDEGLVFVSPDIATCPDCERELFDPDNRRYLHPFINCTACGPRLTILDSMPYDRVRTSMGEFPMCPECEYEYTHASTRRYHAQPVCCNDCGPHLYMIGREERDHEAVRCARKIIRDGGIVAVKGIGGFHLCCDAKNSRAVERLRRLKYRPFKPFAVMMKDIETVRRECVIPDGAEKILTGPQKPIILLERRNITEPDAATELAEAVAPGNPNVGVMLPYAPVQMLLFRYPDGEPVTDCFIMTSGNPSGSPICMNDEEAEQYLSPMCDGILSNNRKIRIRADDSVMSFYKNQPYMIRRSRGYAPLPVIRTEESEHSVIGVGGELKNTFCLSKGDMHYLSPYIGDMADMRSVGALRAAVVRMERLLEIEPEAAACDLHPGYNTSEVARSLAKERGIPLIEVQHHYAHIVSCIAENGWDGEVIGVSFDGTGYGTDGTIWGGEFLRADRKSWQRLGSVMPFDHAGGDLASREGWRIAVSLLGPEMSDAMELGTAKDRAAVAFLIGNGINTIKSTSAGRLFDAVSAILGLKQMNSFEGEMSMALEFAAEKAFREGREPAGYSGPLIRDGADGFFHLETTSLVRSLAERRQKGEEPEELALVFHRALAGMILEGCRKIRKDTGLEAVALSGGVFQNLLLLSLCEEALKADGFRVLRHSLVPPNDGGIAIGQAEAALVRMESPDAR